MSEILLVRHGETEWNAEEIFRGRADINHNEKGIVQAKMLGEYLVNSRLEAVYSSPLQRAVRTAERIAKQRSLDIRTEPALVDLDYGEWQGMPVTEVRKIYSKLYLKWEKSPEKVKFPGGESLDDVRNRVVSVVNKIIKKHKGSVVVVSHRVVNKVLICSMLGLDNSHFWNIRQETCGISSFSYEKGQFVLTKHNDTSFLGNLSGKGQNDF
ncbi:MAG: histidine phosphatase family protein [Dehalococcoidales bacterium]|nr:MAG: histidine phosphatase family protein [Dehalococcoidales bacterium]